MAQKKPITCTCTCRRCRAVRQRTAVVPKKKSFYQSFSKKLTQKRILFSKKISKKSSLLTKQVANATTKVSSQIVTTTNRELKTLKHRVTSLHLEDRLATMFKMPDLAIASPALSFKPPSLAFNLTLKKFSFAQLNGLGRKSSKPTKKKTTKKKSKKVTKQSPTYLKQVEINAIALTTKLRTTFKQFSTTLVVFVSSIKIPPLFWQWSYRTHTITITKKQGVIFKKPSLQLPTLPTLPKFKHRSKLPAFKLPTLPTSIASLSNRFAHYVNQIIQEIREIVGLPAHPTTKSNEKGSKKSRKKSLKTRLKQLRKWLAQPFVALVRFRQRLKKHVPQYATFLVASVLFAAGILSLSYGIYVYVFKDLPEASELVERGQIVTTRILDRNGELLYRIYEDENRTLITLSSLQPHTVQATIAIEDQDFYNHKGFSAKGIVRAFIANVEGKPVQGGSTITQQLVKNRLLSPERTLRRKIREVLLAIVVDGTYTKDQILEMYFNQVAYGGATYGIEEAAQTYFGKPATQLSLAESAMLAGLPAAPSVYNPFGPNPEYAYARQHEVLRRMVVEQFITQEEADAAKAEILQFRNNVIDIKAPHFVMYVKQLLAEQYGEELLNQGGLEVTTTLDLEMQNATQEIVTKEVENLAKLRVSNGAALVTKPQTGEVLSMIGSKDYFDFEHDGQVNVTLRPRQPGSSIKPLTYAVALERGKTPYTLIDDSPITYNMAGSPPYSPKNYDGKFHGRVTLRQSLGSSYNIPAVKMLAEVGINTVIDKAEAMGVSTWKDRNRFGLSLTLGGGEVLMTELAQIYGTFANNGYTEPLNPILEVKNSKGEVLYRNTCALDGVGCIKKRNLDPRVAYQITDILKDNNARIPAFGPRSVLHIPGQEVAVKTGTTNNLRDNWTVGYTSDILVAVWVGNNDNTPMSYVASGVTGASPIWNNIIRLTLDDANPHRFSVPDGLVKVNICERTGTLTCSGCPRTIEAFYVAGTEPTQACNPAQFRPRPTAAPTANPNDPNRDQILEGIAI
jgi:1A family penicillin-binding protein